MHRLLLCVLLLLLPPLALAAPQYELVDLGTELRLVALEPGSASRRHPSRTSAPAPPFSR